MHTVPEIRQRDSYSCGLAAVKSVLRYWGRSTRITIPMSERDGTHPAAIQSALRESGLQVFTGEIDSLLSMLTRQGMPVICLTYLHGNGHYVVAYRVSRGKVYYMDPNAGYAALPWADWQECWRDVDVFSTHYRRFGIVAQPGEA